MTKNHGPKKLARAAARKLNLPLSEAKQYLAREGASPVSHDARLVESRMTSNFASNHAENLTLTTPNGRTRPTDRPASAPVEFHPDDEVQFHGDRFWWAVQAVGERGTLVLTRKAAFGEGGVYTIVHWGRGWRGPHDSWGHPAVTREECQEVAAAIEAGEDLLDMSVRNSVYLDLKKVRRGKLVLWVDDSAA
jgi:hypothetical protein